MTFGLPPRIAGLRSELRATERNGRLSRLFGRRWPFSFGRILAADSRGGCRPCVMDVRMTEEWTWT